MNLFLKISASTGFSYQFQNNINLQANVKQSYSSFFAPTPPLERSHCYSCLLKQNPSVHYYHLSSIDTHTPPFNNVQDDILTAKLANW